MIFKIIFGFLRSMRVLVGIIFGFQVVNLLPAITWLADLGSVSGAYWGVLLAKLIHATVFGGMFFLFRRLINYIHLKRFGVLHPTFATSKWAL